MPNLVIVAIPDENDRVWKVSSEEIPHMTLLFLGDADAVGNPDQIVQFVEHAANTTLKRFYMPVDRRGELGDDKADVLFFKKNRYDSRAIYDFRSQLLKDDNIKTAYDSTEQFEGPWKPHLTLGYPETPAKPQDADHDYAFYDVSFDKIAVWFGDFEGPEFLLKDHWDDFDDMASVPLDVAMSGIMHHAVDDYEQSVELGSAFLAHYGVKGMRWGHRKSGTEEKISRWDPQGHSLAGDVAKGYLLAPIPVVQLLSIPANVRLTRGAFRAGTAYGAHVKEGKEAKKKAEDDAKFEKVAKSHETVAAIHNGSVDKMNSGIKSINDRYSEADLKSPAKQKKYDGEVLKLMQDSYRDSANSLTNKRGDKHLDLEFKNDGMDFTIKVKDGPPKLTVEHADIDDNDVVTFNGKIKRTPTGHIVGLDFEDFDQPDMVHALDAGADFLEHFGVKGMRWGVRKTRDAAFRAAPQLPVSSIVVQQRVAMPARKALKKDLPDIKARHGDYGKMSKRATKPMSKEARAYRKDVKDTYIKHLESTANSITNASGTRQYTVTKQFTLGEKGRPATSQYTWLVKSRDIKHAADDLEFAVRPIFEDGYIVDIEDVSPDELAQSSIEDGAEFLEHFGVKGMRWGVRKEDVVNAAKSAGGAIGKAAAATERFALDVHFESKTTVPLEGGWSKAKDEVYGNAHAPYTKTDLPAVKERHGDYAKLRNRVKKPFSKEARAYRKDARETYMKRLETEANKIKNASGDRQYTIRERGIDQPAGGGKIPTSKWAWEVTARDVEHALGPDMTIEVIMDSEGWITDIKPIQPLDTLAQSGLDVTELGEAFVIEHFGVKGMRWGVRRDAPTAVGATAASHVPHGNRRKTKIKVEGGQNHEASPDALKVAEARTKLKKSGVAALSNAELKEMQTRLQLETQVAQLTSNRGQKFITRQLEQQGQQTVQGVARTYGPRVAKKGAKKAGKTAAKIAIGAALL